MYTQCLQLHRAPIINIFSTLFYFLGEYFLIMTIKQKGKTLSIYIGEMENYLPDGVCRANRQIRNRKRITTEAQSFNKG